MQLIFGRENAEKLKERYTVLELETVEKEGTSIEVFCLIPGEKIGLPDLPTVDQWIKLHNDFLNGYQTNQYEYCRQCIEHLMGKFGGEVDTFYEEILTRINKADPK
jgi:hypothetical protein|tara:strand:+ start:78 stop:395 length:318 start_codon:yes stop_codon:yes gene_type:complete